MLTLSLDGLSSSCILCPNVDIVSRVFIFILYLVCPMLTLSLDCLSSSCILCTQCWQCLSIVYLHPVSCVPNVDSVSRLFIFILYLVYPMLTLSLDCLSSSCILLCPMLTLSLECLSSSCILCTQCWHCLSIVYLHPVSCVPNVDSVLSIVYLHPVSCVPNVDSVSRLFIFILYLLYPMLTLSLDCLSSSCILCAQCWHCLSSVYLHLYLVCPMLTVSLDCLSSSCILCTQCWHCLSIVYLHPVSCVPNVDSVSRLFIFILYLVCLCWQCLSSVYLHPVSCVPMLTVSLDGLSSSCILCAQCWQCLSIVFLHPVSCVPNVGIVSRLFIFILYLVYPMLDSVSRLFIFILYLVCPMLTLSLDCFIFTLYLVYPMLTVSLDCLSSSCILCAQCWHCLSSVYLHPVSCVPNVDSVSRLFIFILYLVYPMLTVSLDCLSSSCILCA